MNRVQRGKSNRVSASEIGQFHFCPMSWFLYRKGCVPTSQYLKIGKMKHDKMGMIIKNTNHLKNRAYVLGFIGISFIIISMLLWLFKVIQ